MSFASLNGLKRLFILRQFKLIYNSYWSFIWGLISKNDIRICGTKFYNMYDSIIEYAVLVRDAEL